MSIVRAPRPETNWYLLDKRISEDSRLSWAARGMLIFLLGKPDHWRVSVKALINETAGAQKSSGRDAVYGLLRELQDAGYVERQQRMTAAGAYEEVDYIVHESPDLPLTENPEAAPLTGLPDTAEPLTANPTLVNTDKAVSTEVKQRQTVRAARFDAQAHLVAIGVDPTVAADWLKTRKEKKLAPTATAFAAVAAEAEKAGLTMAEAVRTACENGWGGFRAEWLQGTARTANGRKGGGNWRVSDELALAKAIEVGVGPAWPSESRDAYHARIQSAIDNGGAPPVVRPATSPVAAEPQKVESRVAMPADTRQALLDAAKRSSRPRHLNAGVA